MSEFIDIFVNLSNFILYVPEVGLIDSLFCPEGSVFVCNDCPGGGFLLPSSCVPGVRPRGLSQGGGYG